MGLFHIRQEAFGNSLFDLDCCTISWRDAPRKGSAKLFASERERSFEQSRSYHQAFPLSMYLRCPESVLAACTV